MALKPKFEVQDVHFSGKQLSLHCLIVEPGEKKYVYHLSDDTNHDPIFVNEVLEDIFERWEIKNETVMIKSNNAPTEYKNKHAFKSMQNLANRYNVRIIRIYGAAGHEKGLIDAMSSFGVKSILRRDIVTQDCWFQNSEEVCNYLSSRSDCRMSYSNLDPAKVNRNRLTKDGLVIKGCMSEHIFEYVPNSNNVFNKEYLCDCQECINFNFHSCLKEVGDVENMEETQESFIMPDVIPKSEHYDDCLMDDENEKGLKIFDFTDVLSFDAVVTFSLAEPIYIIKVTEKEKGTEKM